MFSPASPYIFSPFALPPNRKRPRGLNSRGLTFLVERGLLVTWGKGLLRIGMGAEGEVSLSPPGEAEGKKVDETFKKSRKWGNEGGLSWPEKVIIRIKKS